MSDPKDQEASAAAAAPQQPELPPTEGGDDVPMAAAEASPSPPPPPPSPPPPPPSEAGAGPQRQPPAGASADIPGADGGGPPAAAGAAGDGGAQDGSGDGDAGTEDPQGRKGPAEQRPPAAGAKRKEAPGTEASAADGGGPAADGAGRKGPPPVLPTKLKKARTAYFLFLEEKRPEVTAMHRGEPVGVIAKKMGEMWKSLPPEEKQVYQDAAAKEKEEHARTREAMREAGLLPDPASGTGGTGGGGGAAPPPGQLLFPVARIRKICKLDPEVRGLSREGVHLITRATELFTERLGLQAVQYASLHNRRKVLMEDVAEVCSNKEHFLFLNEDLRAMVTDYKAEVAAGKEKSAAEAKARETAEGQAGGSGSKPLTSYFAPGPAPASSDVAAAGPGSAKSGK